MPESTSRIEKMSAAAKDPIVIFHKYNKLRSREPSQLVMVFEGFEDPGFYSAMAQKCGFFTPYIPLVANGKDFVLGLRRLLLSSKEAALGGGVAFFVDHDYDGLKGHPEGAEIFCTPSYSIENLVTGTEVVRTLLTNELRLHDPDLLDDRDRCIADYDRLCLQFIEEIRDINSLIFFGRTKSWAECGSKLLSIDDNRSVFTLDRRTITVKVHYKKDDAKKIVLFSMDFDFEKCHESATAFEGLDPRLYWRGKYWFELMRKFFEILIEDRNSAAPMHFKQGNGKVSLNFSGDAIFRLLGSACEVPPSLREFFSGLPQSALHSSVN